jgi:ankyrin repeat protein
LRQKSPEETKRISTELSKQLDTNLFPFLEYSALNWMFHYQDGYGQPYAHDMAFNLCNPDSKNFLTWFNIVRNSSQDTFFSGLNISLAQCTHLLIASALGFTQMAEKLIQKDPNVNAEGGTLSPLCLAICSGRLDLVKCLLSAGADPQSNNLHDLRSSPLCLAVEQGNPDLVQLLLNRGAAKSINIAVRNKAPLERSVTCWRNSDDAEPTTVMTLLLKNGAEVNPTDRVSALRYAARHEPWDIISILLDHGADVNHNVPDTFQCTPPAACSAAANGSIDLLETFISYGADINIADNSIQSSRSTPLVLAVAYEQEAAVKFLLAQKDIRLEGLGLSTKRMLSLLSRGDSGQGKSPSPLLQETATNETRIYSTV